jgi:tetratricopeptide (TPR) repeat protein
MDALISGEAGVALLIDGAALRSLRLGAAAQPTRRRREAVPFLFGDARDLQVVENVTEREVAVRLERAAARIDGLQLILILLDPTLADDTRQEATAEAEELLAQAGTAEAVENILYAQPLPAAADPAGALHACANRAPRAAQLVSQLVARQPLIALVRQAWEEVPLAVFGTPEDRERVQAVFVREGLFRGLVLLREAGQSMDQFLVGAMLNPDVKRLARHRDILQSWIDPFQQGRKKRRLESERVETADVVAEDVAPSYRRGFDRQRRLAGVEWQKAVIVRAMEEGDLERVRGNVDELIEIQTSGGQDPRYACMSLCDLAMKAKSLWLPDLQLELSRRATKLKEDDARSWVQYADALLDAGSLDEALAAAQNGIAFGELVVGKTVLAEVLLASGKPNEALAIYEEVIESNPGDEVARNGRAEVLRSMNRLEEALAAYQETIDASPQDVFARTGRAEVLRSMNRLEEALAAYDETIVAFPQVVVARDGRADVLRSMNHLDEALAAYEEIIVVFPQDVFARTGRAEVLRSLNRPEVALAAYEQTIVAFPKDVVARNGRAEVLRSMNRLKEALVAYEDTIVEFPQNVFARCGKAEVLRSMNRPEEALTAYEATIVAFPHNVVARSGRAVVLAELGRWDEALAGLPATPPISNQDWIGYHIRGMVLLRKGNLDEAAAVFSAGMQAHLPAEQRDYFRSALALTDLRRGQAAAAAAALNEIETRAIDPIANLLRLHAFCVLSRRELAAEADRKLAAAPEPALQEVRSELRRRFMAAGQPLHSEQWILEQETGLLLAAVGTLLSVRRMRPLSGM